LKTHVLLIVLFLVGLAGSGAVHAEDWGSLRAQALKLAAKPGEADKKFDLLERIAGDDSARAVKLMGRFASTTEARRAKSESQLESARKRYSKATRRLRKKYGRKASRSVMEQDPKWRRARDEVDRLKRELVTDRDVLVACREGFAGFSSPEAIAVLVDARDRDLSRARKSMEIRAGILRALWSQPPHRVAVALLVYAEDESMPHARARVLEWIGAKKVMEGYDAAILGLRAKESAVARAAVRALSGLDRPECVPALVKTRRNADGLLAEELEIALYRFTGNKFFGSGADVTWSSWWKGQGESWLRNAQAERHDTSKLERKGNASFYGIETRSDRIVFVLDRSGSMKEPVPQRAVVTGKVPDSHVPGKTKLEVAKNQLARTIGKINKHVKFAVIFYSHEVDVWKTPPGLVPGEPHNRRDATAWFMRLEPVGSTMTFDALAKALEYAKVGGGRSATDPKGADTIFLLSDGAPTDPGGNFALSGEALEAKVQAFLEANRAFGCVVHTIGVGPLHNARFMKRLAAETGGTYKAVGVRR